MKYVAELHNSHHGKPIIFASKRERRKAVHTLVGRAIEREPFWISRDGVLEYRQHGIAVDYFKVKEDV